MQDLSGRRVTARTGNTKKRSDGRKKSMPTSCRNAPKSASHTSSRAHQDERTCTLTPISKHCLSEIHWGMRTVLRTLFLCFLTSGVLLADENTLLVESAGDKVTYSLNGVALPLGKLLDSTTSIIGKDMESPIVVIFDSNIGLDVVLNAQGIFNKVGFQNVRLFMRSRKTEKMCEVSLGSPVSFTPNPK